MTEIRAGIWARRIGWALGAIACAAALQACATDRSGGLHLPRGDADRGREAFVDLRCNFCHEIEGFDPPTPIVAETRVALGDRNGRVRAYGDLVTSIVNPSHRLARGYAAEDITVGGRSVMSLIYLNEVMTVQQLVDLVAFLEREYDVVPPAIRLEDLYPEG
jgi:hypothetical protein